VKYLTILLMATGLFAAGIDVDALRWQNRIVLVFGPSAVHEEVVRQVKVFTEDACGVDDRDLVVSPVGAAAELRERFGVATDEFAVLLIGKDGGVKLRSSEVVSRDRIYALIDGMPMRRQEMRRKGNVCGE
jgi:hypothetical protein